VDYSDFVDTAAELIAEYGQAATVRHVVNLAADSGVTITVDATGKTYTRNQGSWIDDGFVVGDSVTFAKFASAGNNGAKVASTVEALVLTCSAATGLVDEADVYDVTAAANHDTACDVVEKNVNSISMYASSLMAGASVSESTRFFMLAGATPQAMDKLITAAKTFTIEGFRPLSPGDTVIYWVVRVKA
jgi:hypothetical protein